LNVEGDRIACSFSQLVNQANRGQANPHIKDRIRIVRGMVEDEKVQSSVLKTGQVDTIISEPIGVMLFHERMVESYLLARDLFLKPGGQMLPSGGSLWFCPFSDEALHTETDQKVGLGWEGRVPDW
jgi:histone-arginine methyltransferase CARM1